MRDGEVVCNKCDGRGCLDVLGSPDLLQQCPKCKGNKKVDWIENVIGKKYIEFDIEPIDFPMGVK
jgi:DnaJ-class molecular chaperone